MGEVLSRSTLEAWLRGEAGRDGSEPRACPRCGKLAPVRAKDRERRLRAVSGEVRFVRNYHYCKACKSGFYPVDERLGLPDKGDLTPEMERRLLDFGVHDTFDAAAERWAVHYATPVSENLVRRVVERQGDVLASRDLDAVQEVAAAKRKPADLLVVQADGGMVPTRDTDRWREVKVAVVARGDCHLSSREAPRGRITEARYAATWEAFDEFRRRVDALLRAEHVDQVGKVVWVGDGAPWIWNVADELCPKAVHILDWYHAVEAASTAAKAVFGPACPCTELLVSRVSMLLRMGDVDEVLSELEACLFLTRVAAARAALKTLIGYYTKNKSRMDYLSFVANGYPIGSGFVEAANKHVIQARMKLAGQHWDTHRADRMANLRALLATTGPTRLHRAISAAA